MMESCLARLRNCESDTRSLPELLADHMLNWDKRCEVTRPRGIPGCASLYSWLACAAAFTDPNPVCDETLASFPLLKLSDIWLHSDDVQPIGRMNEQGEIPTLPMERISNMSQQELMDTLKGLEWHVFSDPEFTNRPDEWWVQAHTLFRLLVRAAFFMVRQEYDISYINMQKFSLKRTWNFLGGVASVQGQRDVSGYVSDGEEDEEEEEPASTALRPFPTNTNEPGGIWTQKHSEVKRQLARARARKRTRHHVVGAADNKAPVVTISDEVEKASVNLAWLFEMDTITTYFWRKAFEHETHPAPIPYPPCMLGYFRAWLFDEVKRTSEDTVKTFRRVWYDDMIVTDSYRRIYLYYNPLEPMPKSRAIINSKDLRLHKQHCHSIADVTKEDENVIIQRFNTDAMFFMHARTLASMSSGDPVQAVYRASLAEVDGPLCIYRDAIRNVWVVYHSFEERYSAPSFTAAFFHMREQMRERGISPLKNGVNLGVWDEHFKEPKPVL